MTLSVVFTPSGPVAPTFAEILASLKDTMRSIYGSDIYLEADSQDGQWLSALATLIHDNNDAAIAAYNGFSPATAQGVGLSNVVKINGIRRLVPTNSQVVVRIVGEVGTEIIEGQVSGPTTDVKWHLPGSVVIPNAGQIDVTATAVNAGAIEASIGTVVGIVTPTRGWQSVTNLAAATPGSPVETDATLRRRQSQSTSLPAQSILASIKAAIADLDGVVRVEVYENKTGTPDGNGIPGHSISAVVQGGDITEIAENINLYTSPGTGTYGDESVTVIDPGGIPVDINFYVLDLMTVHMIVHITALTGYLSSTATLIAQSVVGWLNSLSIGEDVYLNRLWSPVNLSGEAAILATGQSQASLDALSATYNATAIYQATDDMVVTGGPYAAGAVALSVTDATNYVIGNKAVIVLDNASQHLVTISNKVGSVLTFAPAIPMGRSAENGALVFANCDITTSFRQAASALIANVQVEVP